MQRAPGAVSRSTRVSDRIRVDIFDGVWAPGARLGIEELGQRYDASSTVVREALIGLAADRLIESKPNRGFFVRTITPGEFADLTELRCRIEEFGIELAIERGDVQWESAAIAAHHELARTEPWRTDAPELLRSEWVTAHHAFHDALLAASGVPLVADLARSIDASTALQRTWAAAAHPRDIAGEDRAILDAVLARDAAAASRLLRAHYEETLEAVRRAVGSASGATVDSH